MDPAAKLANGIRSLGDGTEASLLVAKIEGLGHSMWEAGREKELWAEQSAETWHDNFG